MHTEQEITKTLDKMTAALAVLEQHHARSVDVVRTVQRIQRELDEVKSMTVEAIDLYRGLLETVRERDRKNG